ncbi:hypothetical protein WJ74_08440 [Burkholderia ubonensis]|nr:hypothetical protein WJ74_08440 [Burkholderia ubonensis]
MLPHAGVGLALELQRVSVVDQLWAALGVPLRCAPCRRCALRLPGLAAAFGARLAPGGGTRRRERPRVVWLDRPGTAAFALHPFVSG